MKLNVRRITKFCNKPIGYFTRFGNVLSTNNNGLLVYQDNGASILGVAHLDTVCKPLKARVLSPDIVQSLAMDDRLGAYILLDVLKRQGLRFDVLLTDREESAQTTAQYFNPQKSYNWIFEFDRAGDDVVLYNYDDKDTREILTTFDFNVGLGSFSDISWLEHLGVKAFNFGTCYYRAHTQGCYADLVQLKSQVQKFINFYNCYKDIKLPHVPLEYDDYIVYDDYTDDFWDNYQGEGSQYCQYCDGDIYTSEEMEIGLCNYCLEFLVRHE